MRHRTVLLACVAVTLGVAEPASAQDVPAPLPSLEADVAAVVATATEGLVDVELPTIDVPTPVVAPEPESAPSELPPSPPEPVDAAPEAQYQVDEPQYQSDPAAEETEVTTSDADPAGAPSSPAPDAPAAPVDTSAPTDAVAGVPDTWTWEWNWNCEGGASLPAAPANVEGWTWTWNWDCNANADPQLDLGQYQAPITQYQPENINLGIRIASPGDDGPVTQTISTVQHVTTMLVTEVVQSVVQVVERVVPVAAPAAVPILRLPLPVVVAEPGAVAAVVETILLPPLVGPPPPDAPSATTRPPELLAPTGPSVGLPADRGTNPSDGLAWPQAVRPTADARRAPASRPAKAPPREGTRLPLSPSVPGGPGGGAAQSASAPALALGALAAALAAYLLVPPLGARRLRRARDRRRLGLLAAPLERPG